MRRSQRMHLLVWSIFLVASCVPDGTHAVFTPVDTSQLHQRELDATRLGDPSYMQAWLAEDYGPIATTLSRAEVLASWDYETNITPENEAGTEQASQAGAAFSRMVAEIIAHFNFTNSSSDDPLAIQMKNVQKSMVELGDANLPKEELKELVSIVNSMTNIFSTAKICFDPEMEVAELEQMKADCPADKLMALDPGLTKFFRNNTWDSAKRRYVWREWRTATGVMRTNYTRYVELKNKAARLTGYADQGELWRSGYTEDSLNVTDAVIQKDLNDLWLQIQPLYRELHAYVRRKLIEKLPNEELSSTGPIPAHLLGDMWSQEWSAMLNFTQIFPDRPSLDVTEEMKAQNYTVQQMFRLSEDFQVGLGLMPMPESFWELSMMEKPTDGREVVCHASASDFYTDQDVRIKMCTEKNMDDLITIHHEMGHIQYFLQYSDQLLPFREGANSGFHEAVGDTLALSVKTPKHLAWLGLLKNHTDDVASDLNYQFATALDKIAFLPFAYIMDRWRYDVFSGKISSEKLNQGWWDYASEYQGIVPPVPRSENDFDPGAKFHIASDTEYMRYFISFIIQFQFHRALCDASGHVGPLYQCDINQSKAAGKLLSDMLSLGGSQPWPVAMEKITGSRKMDAAPLLEFFQPLYKHLQQVNAASGDIPGWTMS
ncbi:hypothetical protein RvY_13773-2 [Ramazzottius varieornatus]|uniref:Angiotensin-converting enzyme n=1 Tax=Ramazzottius varieornatus TaxID=947166 RepID=A0A1D1VQU8_RAMVA|nr:hypothetical protein RvY_13773-2 [Ramazzottius varieornatus]